MKNFDLKRNSFGKLMLTSPDGMLLHEGVVPVRSFPIADPDSGIALVDEDGRELAWIERMSNLPPALRMLLEEELAQRDFLPEIRRILSVSTFAVPSTWHIETNRGLTTLVLKGEEDIRRITQKTLVIADIHGVQYLLRDLTALDHTSRKFVDRFL